MVAIYGGFFLFTSLLTYAVLMWNAEKKEHIQKRIQAYFSRNTPESLTEEEAEKSFYERVIKPGWVTFTKKLNRKLVKKEAVKLEKVLMQAGQPFGLTPVGFKMLQVLLLIMFPLVGATLTIVAGYGLLVILLVILSCMGAAVILPKYYLKAAIKKRSKMAGKELPDILDLLTISLEAGLGFDSALSQVVAKKKGEVIKEFKLCLEEMRLGKTRKDALNAINERLSSEDLQALLYSIIQAEKLGIGMVSVLRVQTEDIREKRKQKAEEAAMKAPIKMMFPLVLFIFPTLFIILLGPAILQFMEAF